MKVWLKRKRKAKEFPYTYRASNEHIEVANNIGLLWVELIAG
jgi:hypothetical protein